jgi:hypothetical protein
VELPEPLLEPLEPPLELPELLLEPLELPLAHRCDVVGAM